MLKNFETKRNGERANHVSFERLTLANVTSVPFALLALYLFATRIAPIMAMPTLIQVAKYMPFMIPEVISIFLQMIVMVYIFTRSGYSIYKRLFVNYTDEQAFRINSHRVALLVAFAIMIVLTLIKLVF